MDPAREEHVQSAEAVAILPLRQRCCDALDRAYQSLGQQIGSDMDYEIMGFMKYDHLEEHSAREQARDELGRNPGRYQVPTDEAELLGCVASEHDVDDEIMLCFTKQIAARETQHCQMIKSSHGICLVCYSQFSWALLGTWALRSGYFGETHRQTLLRAVLVSQDVDLLSRVPSLLTLSAIAMCGHLQRLPTYMYIGERDLRACLTALRRAVMLHSTG